jgi:uncharacterized protein (DUF952 family)
MILHITTAAEWKAAEATGVYRADTLETEGFIHCSTPEQVVGVANERFRGRTDLILLCIDPARLEPAVVFEDCYESGQEFPHIYGPLTVADVMGVVDFPPGADGRFTLPAEVTALQAEEPVWLCETEEEIMTAAQQARPEGDSS